MQKENVASSHLFAETEGTQEGLHIIKLSVAEALQPLWVTGLSGQTHCTDLVCRKKKKTETEKLHCMANINRIKRNKLVRKWAKKRRKWDAFGINMS